MFNNNKQGIEEYTERISPRVLKSQVEDLHKISNTCSEQFGRSLKTTDMVKIGLELFIQKVESDPAALEQILKEWRYI